MRANPEEQLEYLDRVAHNDPYNLINIDGMAQSPDDFHDKYGWSPVGEDAIRMEIEIGNLFFAVHVMYGPCNVSLHCAWFLGMGDL
jgi:hypothetical protein